jgi:hypothetical protein
MLVKASTGRSGRPPWANDADGASQAPRPPAVSARASAQDQQVVRDHAGTHPPLHAREASISAATEAVAPLQHADAPFAAGPPFERGSNSAPAAFPALPRQDHVLHSARVRGPLVCPGGKARVGHGQARGSAEELLVPEERGDPQSLVRHAPLADLVVRDELRLGFLDLHQLAELGGLHRLPLADRLGVRLEEAQELVRVVGIALDDPRAGLSQHPPDQAARVPELLRQALDLELGRGRRPSPLRPRLAPPRSQPAGPPRRCGP